MSYASAVSLSFCSARLDLAPFRRIARLAALVAQAAGFAAVLWLAAAGPGLLCQQDSTVAARPMR